jgi:hypothetical protein
LSLEASREGNQIYPTISLPHTGTPEISVTSKPEFDRPKPPLADHRKLTEK